MNQDKNGGSAFPQVESQQVGSQGEYHTDVYSVGGMSLRDYLAAKALPLAWAIEQERPTGPYREKMEPTYDGAATRAYFMADAMLRARAAG